MAGKAKKIADKFHLFVFLKAQFSAFIGGMTDMGIRLILTELFGIFYSISIIIGGIVGALVNFTINRKFTYLAENEKAHKQLVKFVFVVLGSVLLKSYGTYLLTTWTGWDYKITMLIIELIVSLGFNYTLQTYWVFKGGKAMQKEEETVDETALP